MPKSAATKTSSKSKKKTKKQKSAGAGAGGPGVGGGAAARPASKAYGKLVAELREAAVLHSVQATLAWDQETVMPSAASGLRAEQLQMLSAMVHERRTSKRLRSLIGEAEADKKVRKDGVASANLREIRRDFRLLTRVPTELVAEMARSSSLGMAAWKEARAKSDFGMFLPWLKKTVELNRKKAKHLGKPKGGKELYDALLDLYEPGMTAARTEAIFTPLRARLAPLIARVGGAPRKPDTGPAHLASDIERQKKLVHEVTAAIGFDLEGGRIDESAHPFCESPGPGDTRFTNRYRPDGWADAVFTALHEAGHGLYEQGLPKGEHFGQPIADAISLGIHESQSRMWENLVGRSRAFWEWATPLARKTLGGGASSLTAEGVHRAVNAVEAGFIRIESDEVTYNLHIMLRFDLERAMIAGDLDPADLPAVWNRRMKEDLGLTVPEDRLGCLQDVHWSMGMMGYFPTYTFGNLYAAQFWEAMARALPERDAMMARGEFGPILAWLRANIHAHGRRYGAEELCELVTGAPLSADPLVRHLEAKIKAVYGV
ncbi:MAG: carboxypeptidase M32 [Phycisphaerales bacterium]|nr:carboxypeptidase M32 [Phycisphaerales bacterium]